MADTTEGVEVRLGADTAEAKSGMDSAAASINASLQSINKTLETFKATSANTAHAVQQHTKATSDAFSFLHENIRARFGSINTVVEQFSSRIIGLGIAFGVFAGLHSIAKRATDDIIGFRDAVHSLETQFGLTATAASLLAVNLKLAGVNVDTYGMMAQRLSMKLHTQPEEFERLGVKVRDVHGQFLPLDEILQNTYQRMLDFKPGTDQMQFALSTIGRNAKDFKEDMENLNLTNARAKEMMQSLGLEMDDAAQDKVRRYKVEINAMRLTMEAIGVKLATLMLPQMQKLGELLVSYGPAVIDAVASAYKVLSTAFSAVIQFATPVWEILKKIVTEIASSEPVMAAFRVVLDLLVISFRVLGTVLEIAMQGLYQIWEVFRFGVAVIYDVSKALAGFFENIGHWDKAKAAIKGAWTDIEKDFTDGMARIVKSNEEGAERIKAIWSGVGAKQELIGRGKAFSIEKPEGKTPYPALDKNAPNQLELWRAQLEGLKEAQGYFNEYSKEQEAAFWASKLALTKAGSKEYIEVHHLMYEAAKAAAHESYDEQLIALHQELTAAAGNEAAQEAIMARIVAYVRDHYKEQTKYVQAALAEQNKLREEWAKKEEEIVRQNEKFHIDLLKAEQKEQEAFLTGEVAAGRISADQKIETERGMEAQIYAAELDAVNKYILTLQVGTKEYFAALQQRLALTVEFNNNMLKLAQEEEKEREQYALRADQAIQNSLGSLIEGLVNRTKTLRQTWQDFVKQLTTDLNKIATDQVMKQLLGPGTQGGNFLSGITSKIFGTGGTAQAATQQANTTALATLTLAIQANTVALQAGGAAGGIGGLFGGGGGGGVFSDNGGSAFDASFLPGFAEGTAYVPQTSLALVHQGEAIIPARYNNGSGMNMTNHTHIYLSGAVDTRTQHQISKAAADGVRRAQIRANGS